MFKNLHSAFLEAIENFKYELERDPTLEIPSDLPESMREKIGDALELIRNLQKDIQKCLNQAQKENDQASSCRRRKELAIGIKDTETANIAEQYMVRHERSQRIFEQKTVVLQNELSMRKDELQLMLEMLKGINEEHSDEKSSDLLNQHHFSDVDLPAEKSEPFEAHKTERPKDKHSKE